MSSMMVRQLQWVYGGIIGSVFDVSMETLDGERDSPVIDEIMCSFAFDCMVPLSDRVDEDGSNNRGVVPVVGEV
ncbi:hypothetical protein M5689_012632 [Euphorbia peplus]|nr:hypothetical protein M5689_012632 [Euphorbia peplus]